MDKNCISLLKTSTYSLNKKNKANGLDLLADINDGTVATAFFDPQYRGVLDKLKYGNEGQARGKARCELVHDNCDDAIEKYFAKEASNVLQDLGAQLLTLASHPNIKKIVDTAPNGL